MPDWEFIDTDITNGLNFNIVSMTLDNSGGGSYVFLHNETRQLSLSNYQTWIFGATTCPFGPYIPANDQIFPGGHGTFTGESYARLETEAYAHMYYFPIGPVDSPGGCSLIFNWQQNAQAGEGNPTPHTLVVGKLASLDKKALAASKTILEEAKTRFANDHPEVCNLLSPGPKPSTEEMHV